MSDDNAQASSNGDASAPDLGTKGKRLIAIHNYKPQDEGDLKLKKGQLVIAMANQEDEGWYFGFDPETGAEGEFPANYVADEGSDKANALLLSLKQKAEKAAAEAAKATEDDAAEGAKKVDQEMSDLPLDDEDEKSGADVENESEGPTGKTSSEAAATAAAERTAPYIDSVFLNLKYAIILRGVMALLALFGFACVAGGGYHNLTSKSRQVFTATTTTVMNQTVTVTDSAVDLSGVFYNIISAVQFLLAMGILIWLYETLVCIVFVLWYMERIEEYSWLAKALLGVDSFFFFMLVVAGFNMGSAAMFDAQAIEVLLNAEINQSKSTEFSLRCTLLLWSALFPVPDSPFVRILFDSLAIPAQF